MIIYVTLNAHFTTFEVSNVEAGYVVSKNLLESKAKPLLQTKRLSKSLIHTVGFLHAPQTFAIFTVWFTSWKAFKTCFKTRAWSLKCEKGSLHIYALQNKGPSLRNKAVWHHKHKMRYKLLLCWKKLFIILFKSQSYQTCFSSFPFLAVKLNIW